MDRPSDPGRHGPRHVSPDIAVRSGRAVRAPDGAIADEAAADEARRRLREQGIVPIEPDDQIGVMLAPHEIVVAVRRSVTLERRKGWLEPGGGLGGDLYVTSQRLVHLGRRPVEYPLGEVREAVVAEGALRLVVGEGRGVEIAVADPCLLRVEIAAVREAARASASGASASGASASGASAHHAGADAMARDGERLTQPGDAPATPIEDQPPSR